MFWQCAGNSIILDIDIRNGSEPIVLGGRRLEACRIAAEKYIGDAFEALCSFCRVMCPNPRRVERPVFGGNDWYCCYGDNSYEKIMLHTRRIAECSKGLEYKPFMVIDDGWQICHHQTKCPADNFNGGPWQISNMNFPGMKKTAEDIITAGAVPGIWFRPLLTAEKLSDEYCLGHSGIKYALDPSVPGVLEKVKTDVSMIRDWGYKLIKHDFSTFDILGKWGVEPQFGENVHFRDKTKATAEIIKKLYFAIRDGAGQTHGLSIRQ